MYSKHHGTQVEKHLVSSPGQGLCQMRLSQATSDCRAKSIFQFFILHQCSV